MFNLLKNVYGNSHAVLCTISCSELSQFLAIAINYITFFSGRSIIMPELLSLILEMNYGIQVENNVSFNSETRTHTMSPMINLEQFST